MFRKGDLVECLMLTGNWVPAVVDHVNEGATETSYIVQVDGERCRRSVQHENLREAPR